MSLKRTVITGEHSTTAKAVKIMTKMSNKFKVSLDSLARYAKLYPSLTVLDFIELILK